jgi:TatA/E family protein of Tat protein translocase
VLDLSPTKLLIIFVVAVVLIGPKRLPQLARQLGAGWQRLRTVSSRIDQEVRQAVPDLPTSHEIARFARSPAAFLDHLANNNEASKSKAVPPTISVPARKKETDVTDLENLDDPTLN